MTAVICVPPPLRSHVGGLSEVIVTEDTVADALAQLTRQNPSLKSYLFDSDGLLRGFVNVFVNENDIRALAGPATRLADGDTVLIVPAIAGGAT